MFLGRENELKSLSTLLDKQTSSLVSCRGRRRIGKSTLIVEFARRHSLRLLVLDGLMPRPDVTNEDQLRHFAEALSLQLRREIATPRYWMAAFSRLDESIVDNAWTVVLDENAQ